MERYEAILEQLKKAQSRGMETFTNRLDFVVQSLEELIQEATASVRGAIPESADECLPIDQVESALAAYRETADAESSRAAKLEAEIEGLRRTAPAAAEGSSLELMRALDSARSQSELLKELLPAISAHAARAVVLVLRDGKVSAWSGIGFTDGETLRSWQGDAAESAAIAKVLEVSRPVRFNPADDGLFQGWLTDQDAPSEVLLIPVVLRGKMMGTVYIDRVEGQPWNPEIAQTLVAQVCWLIDTLQFRPNSTPTLAEAMTLDRAAARKETPAAVKAPEEIGTEPAPIQPEDETARAAEQIIEPDSDALDPSATMRVDVSEMAFSGGEPSAVGDAETVEETSPEPEPPVENVQSEVSFEPEPQTEIPEESFTPEPAAEPQFEPEPVSDFEPRPETPEEVSSPTPATEEPPQAEAAAPEPEPVQPEVQPPVTPPEPEEVELGEDDDDTSTSQFLDEPPPVQPVQPPPEEPEEEVSEDEAQREEARRFARLLVSEIKLYNEEQVERGREAGDIYQRLQEDIDRSREMFEKRIAPEIRENHDYFRDELVRILADGDSEALGM
jgi:hypothetical protein